MDEPTLPNHASAAEIVPPMPVSQPAQTSNASVPAPTGMPEVIQKAIEEAQASRLPGAMFKDPVLQALRELRLQEPAIYANVRATLKALRVEGVDLPLGELEKHISDETKTDAAPEAAADRLVTLAREACTLAHDLDRRAVALIDCGTARQVWYCDTKGFEDWLRGQYYQAYRRGIGQQPIATAIATLQAIGIHDGQQIEVSQRVGKHGLSYVLDMGDERWSTIAIGPTGWSIMAISPVALTRSGTTRALPVPLGGGELDLLWKYANVNAMQRPLVLAWLLEALRPDTPYPVLELVGEQGTAKSTTQKVLRQLVDPSKVPLRGRPKTVEDIFVAAKNSHIVSYENLSSLSVEQQDALCMLSTGGGFAARKLFTNTEECSVELRRPIILNGIAACATRPDLVERTVHIQLPVISRDKRREQSQLDAEWESDYPAIVGGLMDLAAATLAQLSKVQLIQRERMADFQRLGEAMMQAMGQAAGSFSELYSVNQQDGVERALETSPIAMSLERFLASRPEETYWQGSVGTLHRLLLEQCLHDRGNFPKSPRALSDQLQRLAPALRQKGIEVALQARSRNGRQVTIMLLPAASNIGNPSSRPSPTSPDGTGRDDSDGGDGHPPIFRYHKERMPAEPSPPAH